MRYYNLVLNTSSKKIKENAKINLREYAYDDPVAAMNCFMQKNVKNELCFFAFREENEVILATLSVNEKKVSLAGACESITDLLYAIFCVRGFISDPEEITMFDFHSHLLEARRRDLTTNPARIAESTDLWIYYYYNNNQSDRESQIHYDFQEQIVKKNAGHYLGVYDERFLNELENIESHANESTHTINPVHYIVSARSKEAANDMTKVLMKSLLKANRIKSARMEMISDIAPDVYIKGNHLEDIIENNYGGVIIFDLSAKFGCDPEDYVMAGKYLLNLLKKYRNRCLFVFTYNMDSPGFSYHVLPYVSKYVLPVALREGTVSRKRAIDYMAYLIGKSEYAEYAGQAGEYMKQYQGIRFSQTDVLNAYEQFDSWCLNKNIVKAYDCDPGYDFILDRDENDESSYDRLHKLIGLSNVKQQIDEIIASDIIEKERKRRKGRDYRSGTMHMIFGGNPGSAKTTVARLFAGITKEKDILKSGIFVEKGGMDLDGIGCVYAIRKAFTAAEGGVLFIDEAYSMKSDIAVSVLIQEMENRRDDVIVVLAGYNERMREFIKINEGLSSRIPYWIDFPDYTEDELTQIFRIMIKERGFTVTEDAVKAAHGIFASARKVENFGNGRYVRNLVDKAVLNQAGRLISKGKRPDMISKRELFMIKGADIRMTDDGAKTGSKIERIGFAV